VIVKTRDIWSCSDESIFKNDTNDEFHIVWGDGEELVRYLNSYRRSKIRYQRAFNELFEVVMLMRPITQSPSMRICPPEKNDDKCKKNYCDICWENYRKDLLKRKGR
jgi:hypothetical protein